MNNSARTRPRTAFACVKPLKALASGMLAITVLRLTARGISSAPQSVRPSMATASSGSGSPLRFSTFLGGGSYDDISGVARDASGGVVITGSTSSPDFARSVMGSPQVLGRRPASLQDSQIFVARFDSQSTLDFCLLLGGRGSESSSGVALDGQGRIYIAGSTDSPDFLPRQGRQPALGSGRDDDLASDDGAPDDAFVMCLEPDGRQRYSLVLGGRGSDVATAVAVRPDGTAVVVGHTVSPDFPTRQALQPQFVGGEAVMGEPVADAFVAVVSGEGALESSTFLGGRGEDEALAVALAPDGGIVVAGSTSSRDFPTLHALQSRLRLSKQEQSSFEKPPSDAWVCRLSGRGRQMVFSTLLGGGEEDSALGVAVGPDSSVFVTGRTASMDFPVTPGAAQTRHAPFEDYMPEQYPDAFALRLSAEGSALIYSTFLGGSQADSGSAIAVDEQGRAYVTGSTDSPNFPLRRPFQSTFGGMTEAFVARLRDGDGALEYATLLGGPESEGGAAITLGQDGEVWVAGSTESANFPTRRPSQALFASRPLGVPSSTYTPPDGFLTRLSTQPSDWRDLTPPRISLSSPRAGQSVAYLRSVAGSVSDGPDGSGVARVTISLEAILQDTERIEDGFRAARAGQRVGWNGYQWLVLKPGQVPGPESDDMTENWRYAARLGSSTWSYPQLPTRYVQSGGRGVPQYGPDLVAGVYRLRATATDLAGNSSSASLSVRVVPDKSHPTVTISEPHSRSTRAWPQISGRAWDRGGSGLAQVEVSLRRLRNPADWDGSRWRTVGGYGDPIWLPARFAGGRWSLRRVPRGARLEPGVYQLQARAVDRAGNSSDLFWLAAGEEAAPGSRPDRTLESLSGGVGYSETSLQVRVRP